jgi:guanylate kinase
MKQLTIVIDFDGTIVNERYPNIDRLKRGARECINELYDAGHIIIINSCRSGDHEKHMRDFLRSCGIKYHVINNNYSPNIEKHGSDSRKLYGDIYIDEKCIFCNGIISWSHIRQTIQNLTVTKPTIICLVGESGSGKTTIGDYIEQEYGIQMIQSYTDRPKRYPTETGHTFITPEVFDTLRHDDMIAYTTFGEYRYCCLKKDVQDRNVYVVDENGYDYLTEHFGDDYRIIGVRVERPMRLRRQYVSEERLDRDVGMFTKPVTEYRYSIWNNYEDVSRLSDDVDRVVIDLFQIKPLTNTIITGVTNASIPPAIKNPPNRIPIE